MAAKKRNYKRGKRRTAKTTHDNRNGTKQDLKVLDYLLSIKEKVVERRVAPWSSGRSYHLPFNAFTKHEYVGKYNLFVLMMRFGFEGYTDPRVITRGKVDELVKEGVKIDWRGQTMTQVWYPRERKEVNEDTGELEVVGVYFKPFFVFNVEQLKGDDLGLPPLPRPAWIGDDADERVETVKAHLTANFKTAPHIDEEPFIRAPYYQPSQHKVVMPPMREYEYEQRYFQSLIHEVCHATGAPSELGRFKTNDYGTPCAPDGGDYAFEEMVTQFATSAILALYGMPMEEEVSASYILSWYKRVEADPSILGRAMGEAVRVVKFIQKDNALPVAPDADDAEDAELMEIAA